MKGVLTGAERKGTGVLMTEAIRVRRLPRIGTYQSNKWLASGSASVSNNARCEED